MYHIYWYHQWIQPVLRRAIKASKGERKNRALIFNKETPVAWAVSQITAGLPNIGFLGRTRAEKLHNWMLILEKSRIEATTIHDWLQPAASAFAGLLLMLFHWLSVMRVGLVSFMMY